MPHSDPYVSLTTEPAETRVVRYDRDGVTALVEVYVGTVDGKPAYAVQDDEVERVLADLGAAATVAWEVLSVRLFKAMERVEEAGVGPVRRQLGCDCSAEV